MELDRNGTRYAGEIRKENQREEFVYHINLSILVCGVALCVPTSEDFRSIVMKIE